MFKTLCSRRQTGFTLFRTLPALPTTTAVAWSATLSLSNHYNLHQTQQRNAASTSTSTPSSSLSSNIVISDWDSNVQKYAHQTAIVQDDNASTFQEMDVAVNNMCLKLLRDYGCRKGDRVMYLGMNFSVHAMQMYIACLKLGLIFVPTNALYTDEQLQALEQSMEPLLVVIPCEYADKTAKNFTNTNANAHGCGEYIVIANTDDTAHNSDSSHLNQGDDGVGTSLTTAALQSELNDIIYDSDIAHITCTSGTTGQPKGVMHNRSFLSGAANVFNNPFMGAIAPNTQSFLLNLKMFGVGALVFASTAMMTASTIILPNRARADDVAEWHALCWKYPSVKLLGLIGRGLPDVVHYGRKMPDSIDTVCYAGDYVPFQSVFDAKQKGLFRADTRFVHAYGQTEAGFVTLLDPQYVERTYARVVRDAEARMDADGGQSGCVYHTNVILPAGNAVDSFWGAEVEIRSADANGVGDVCVRNPQIGVMSGYWRNPQKTADTMDEHGWIKTGDIGKIDDENMLFCYGRSADLILTADGNYVLPIEIENALVTHPAVAEIAVIGHRSGHGNSDGDGDGDGDSDCVEVPVAFVSLVDSTQTTADGDDSWDAIVHQLRDMNQRLLPSDAAQVRDYFQKESLPKSLGNKVAKNVLKQELLSLQQKKAN